MLYDDVVILLYAKAPIEEKVNTRLIPAIGVQAATKLQHDLIHQRLSMLTQANLCAVNLMCAPDSQHECFLQCKQQYPITLFEQTSNNLPDRMSNGVKTEFQTSKSCIVIKSVSTNFSTSH